jgi:hypothetical protein
MTDRSKNKEKADGYVSMRIGKIQEKQESYLEKNEQN